MKRRAMTFFQLKKRHPSICRGACGKLAEGIGTTPGIGRRRMGRRASPVGVSAQSMETNFRVDDDCIHAGSTPVTNEGFVLVPRTKDRHPGVTGVAERRRGWGGVLIFTHATQPLLLLIQGSYVSDQHV